MLEAACHCGRCVLVVPGPPDTVTDCNCSVCFKYGVLWAYYPASAVDRSRLGAQDAYAWRGRVISFHRCHDCGAVTHWWYNGPEGTQAGVNARLFPLAVTSALRVRHLDGAVTEEYVD